MLNWGDKESGDQLAAQMAELLQDRIMTHDQLASCYSIKHGESVSQKLREMSRDRRPMLLGDFLAQMSDYFEVVGPKEVKAKPNAPVATVTAAPASSNGQQTQPANDSTLTVDTVASLPAAASDPTPSAAMKYADVSRGLQGILKEQQAAVSVQMLERLFLEKFHTSIADVVGMTTGEYLQRKENIFDYRAEQATVALHSTVMPGPPLIAAEPGGAKDEEFVVREFEQLIATMGPVVYISTLCGKFIQRNGISVTSIISTRPLDLFKRHPGTFLIVGAGNVTLKKYENIPEVARLLDKPSSKAMRMAKAAEEAQLPVPDFVSEEHVVDEFRRLILNDAAESVYISSLCGRFLQRFKTPVTNIIKCKPTEFLRRYPDVFVMTGGGNVGLREVLGQDAVSVPPPPPRTPKVNREDEMSGAVSGASAAAPECYEGIQLKDEDYWNLSASLMPAAAAQAVQQLLFSVCRHLEQNSVLAVKEAVLGGSACDGMLSELDPQAELVLFVRHLPSKSFSQWLPHMLEALARLLEVDRPPHCTGDIKVEKDHIGAHFAFPASSRHTFARKAAGVGAEAGNTLCVHIYISPVFSDRRELFECMRGAPPGERGFFYPGLVRERRDVLSKQPAAVKECIRLVSWWVVQQRLSSDFERPSHWLIQCLVLKASQTLQQSAAGSVELEALVSKVLGMIAGCETLKVLWSDGKKQGTSAAAIALYDSQDIWKPLLSHEPLCMDPCNPYSNLADANFFDPRALALAAQSAKCYDVFKIEVSKWNAAMTECTEEPNNLLSHMN
mmetsp:Transcript_11142/g.25539  ORF Transcript_11142/g.25539 Transcript_11142/m.25539 type:complete len:785 (-) Transcript_11142:20-2374(-)|eukprot:CAMPEP_0178443682 /NCGR_PEP_ID=MMETSP0689_2-20121128/39043_1 /TAXON_ID=160604 /ORGANISM="Amphidinium massartii, Strain CS-259" /LENGTH=784 /DNA_ID=CAMNT_0020067741 /DNA_START=233 /DNA_END=2587 /DNA_ORIENTATION=+